MRPLPARPQLPKTTTRILREKSENIQSSVDQKSEAKRLYEKARQAAWFRPITKALGKIAGAGERCMFCSGSEASQVEHYRPKSIYPKLTFHWENLLWSCSVCNQPKLNRFPEEPDKRLINPAEENVWDFFFIDKYGNLTPRWQKDLNDWDSRAISTRDILALDRQALQEARQHRRNDLIQRVCDTLQLYKNKSIGLKELRQRKQAWLKQPFQPDVTDYYLNGPGRKEPPFDELADLLT